MRENDGIRRLANLHFRMSPTTPRLGVCGCNTTMTKRVIVSDVRPCLILGHSALVLSTSLCGKHSSVCYACV